MEIVFASITELRPRITHLFEETVAAALDSGGGAMETPHRFACALTGGSTALIFLGALREAAVDWSRITLFWGDERAVAPDSPESNFGLAQELLLTPLGARAPHAIRMPADEPDLTVAAARYASVLPPALDLVILGVGDDGHVCSLFPGHAALQVETARAVAVHDAPKPPPERMTLTMAYLLQARQLWLIAVGERKRQLLQLAISRTEVSTPLDFLVAQAPALTVITDQTLRSERRGAARGINPRRGFT